MITISEFMTEDHAKTMRMIDEYRKGWATFDQMKRAIQRHFFLEEKAVFSFKKSKDPKDLDNAMNLVKEHNDLMDLLIDVEDAEGIEQKKLFNQFLSELYKHSKFEDEDFYPSLDRNLSDAEKERIIARLRQYNVRADSLKRIEADLMTVRTAVFTGSSNMKL